MDDNVSAEMGTDGQETEDGLGFNDLLPETHDVILVLPGTRKPYKFKMVDLPYHEQEELKELIPLPPPPMKKVKGEEEPNFEDPGYKTRLQQVLNDRVLLLLKESLMRAGNLAELRGLSQPEQLNRMQKELGWNKLQALAQVFNDLSESKESEIESLAHSFQRIPKPETDDLRGNGLEQTQMVELAE